MTGRELVAASLRLIGAIAPGESIEASEATDGLSAINRMLSSWSNENLLIYAVTDEEFTLSAGTQSYSMGSGATFNSARPLEIVKALLRDETTSPAIERPIGILTLEEWARIPAKGVESNYPLYLYSERTYPNDTIHLYPKPSAAHKLVLYSLKELTQIASLSTTLSFPPGYEEAMVYNGAIRLAPEYGRQVPAEVAAIANESRANIKRRNHRPKLLRVDPALHVNGGRFNIFSGEVE